MADKHSVFIALTRQANGQDEYGRTRYIRHGDLVPQVVDWPRADIAVARGDILELSPAVCRAIVEAGMRGDDADERSDSANDAAKKSKPTKTR